MHSRQESLLDRDYLSLFECYKLTLHCHCTCLLKTVGLLFLSLLPIILFIILEEPNANLEPHITRPTASKATANLIIARLFSFDHNLWLVIISTLAILAIYGVISKRTKWTVISFLSLIASLESGILTYFIKVLLSRPAPTVAIHRHIHDGFYGFLGLRLNSELTSFPSGHAAIVFAMAVTIYLNNRYPGILALLFAACVSWSRPILGNHYWSDIAAGVVIGTYFGWLGAWTVNIVNKTAFNRRNAQHT